jgi:hypothetical protein
MILIFVAVFQPDGWGKVHQKMKQMEFKNDSIYNFDPNDIDEFISAHNKFLAFNKPPRPDLKEYINEGRNAYVRIWYDIDTCGFLSNFRLDSCNLDLFQKTYTGSEIEKVAFRIAETLPQHKPFIKDGKKSKTTRTAIVHIYY